ncbi:hypothetical protein SAMN04487776_11832 [Priestia megaterium]|nr:hypothetical protein SAMN04487776_11832 [Priestia megaterium]
MKKIYEKGLHVYFIKGVLSIEYGDNINLLDVNGVVVQKTFARKIKR